MSVSPMLLLFLALVFVAVFLLVQGLVVPAFGDTAQARKQLRKRLANIEAEAGQGAFVSLLRENYLKNLTPIQQSLEELPGMARLRAMIEQAGLSTPAWRAVLGCIGFSIAAAAVSLAFGLSVGLSLLIALAAFWLPIVQISRVRAKRMETFERELPDAIDLIKRALRAGQPFSTALRLVGEDMEGPVGKEFQITAADLSYGNDARRALLGLLNRMPSVALMGLVTAVLLQRETGGNLAEVLQQISSVIRGRYKFQRRVRTLSAEGRLSAWVLSMVPLLLGGILTITSPDYLPVLFTDPMGQKLLVAAAVLMTLGILWMRKIIRIQI